MEEPFRLGEKEDEVIFKYTWLMRVDNAVAVVRAGIEVLGGKSRLEARRIWHSPRALCLIQILVAGVVQPSVVQRSGHKAWLIKRRDAVIRPHLDVTSL